MANAFRTQPSALTTSLVNDILATARSVPLDELLADPRRAPGEEHGHGNEATVTEPLRAIDASSGTPHRSADEMARALELVVLLLRGQSAGLRAEHLCKKLGLDKQEMTRVLKQGLATKRLTCQGRKRATTYFAAEG